MEGQADVDALANSVRGISNATATASDSLASLQGSLDALRGAVVDNTSALMAMQDASNGAAGGMQNLAGGARVATAELRMLEGGMPIATAGRFLAQIEGINTIMQVAFPVFGVLALGGALDTVIGKLGDFANAHNPLIEAQKESLGLLEQEGKMYDTLAEKQHKYFLDGVERTQGKGARMRLEAAEHGDAADDAARTIQEIQSLMAEVGRISNPRSASGGLRAPSLPESGDAVQARMNNLLEHLGLTSKGNWGLEGLQAGQGASANQSRAALEMGNQLGEALNLAQHQQKTEKTAQSDDNAKADNDAPKYKVDRFAKEFLDTLDELWGKVLAGEREATNKYIELNNKVYGNDGSSSLLDNFENQSLNRSIFGQSTNGLYSPGSMFARTSDAQQAANLGDWWKQTTGDRAEQLKVTRRDDEDNARRGLQNAGLQLRGSGASEADTVNTLYALKVQYAQKEHDDIVSLADTEKERLDAEDQLKQKLFDAQIDRDNKLLEITAKQKQQYEEMAGSLFDALHTHTINQWGKNFALGQGKQVFENAVTPILSNVGHALGGVTGGNNLGGLLHGTVLDPANAAADTTAKQTTRTADEVHALRGDMRALQGQPAAPDGATGGTGISAPGIPGFSGNPLSTFGSDTNGLTGSGTAMIPSSALFQAGGGSGITQFMSGLGGAGTNPLQAIFGGTSTSANGTVTQLTGAQQAGAAVATAGMLAGAGMTIASGIEQGGAAGFTKAASAGLGAAAVLDPEPISKAILGAAAAVTGIVSSFLGTGPQQRAQQLQDDIVKNQYLAPTALNVMQSPDGTYSDFDARGNLRTSTMSAVPTVAEPYVTKRVINGQQNWYNVPGSVQSPYSGGPQAPGGAPVAGGGISLTIQAIDTQSGIDFITKNHAAVGDALATHLMRDDTRAGTVIRHITGTI
jgi:hypothetical protein